MNYAAGYPKTMVHSSYAPAILSVDSAARPGRPYSIRAAAGAPDRFPPVIVDTAEHEAEMRSKGYHLPGEASQRMTEFYEYPKMLTHPQHADLVPERLEGHMISGTLQTVTIPGSPERYPPVTVASRLEETEWGTKGYRANGVTDSGAFERSQNMPNGRPYEPEEWPKWIDGVLYQDPSAMPEAERRRLENEYPKWVGDRIAASPEEEAELRRGHVAGVKPPDPAPALVPFPPVDAQTLMAMMGQIQELAKGVASLTAAVSDMRNGGAPLLGISPDKWREAAKAVTIVTTRPKRVLSEEHKAKLAAGRAAKRRERNGEGKGREGNARIQSGQAAQRLEEGADGS